MVGRPAGPGPACSRSARDARRGPGDPRTARLRRKPSRIPFRPLRSHSFGGERRAFRFGPRLRAAEAGAFEAGHLIAPLSAHRPFLTEVGGSGAGPYRGLLPTDRCRLFSGPRPSAPDRPGTAGVTRAPGTPGPAGIRTPDTPGLPAAPYGFTCASPSERGRGRFPLVVEAGCPDPRPAGVTGPPTARVITGDADGFREPNVSSARDSLSRYGRWLAPPADGRDDRAPEPAFSSPRRPSPGAPAGMH